jgi:hypothetical protein
MTTACDGLRSANASIAASDENGVSEGWGEMGALDPAGDEGTVDQSALQKGWAAEEAVRSTLRRWDQSPGPDAVEKSDRVIIDRGLEVCEDFDYSWYSPYQFFTD